MLHAQRQAWFGESQMVPWQSRSGWAAAWAVVVRRVKRRRQGREPIATEPAVRGAWYLESSVSSAEPDQLRSARGRG